ncbi:MAG: hypothetical protein LAT68_11320 [Cyclobacteriaceae bacterium]|nr:hypothetical protein [Cyclobacteriaceae bacterium]MCH8516906.1 hypothetical protein [Cyclobacteriaceae bacterium]
MENTCKHCGKVLIGRSDKKYCDPYCKSAFQYQEQKVNQSNFYLKVDRQLKKNRKILSTYTKAGKATARAEVLAEEGFNPKFFTHYWKNNKGEVYLFCYEYGFLSFMDAKGMKKYSLVKWQPYMEKAFLSFN